MKRQITFKPALRKGLPPMEITGEETAYGLVLHPSIGNEDHPESWPTHYTVSDPVSGGQVCLSHGRMEALHELIRIAAIHNRIRPGAFREALKASRAKFIVQTL